MPPTGDVAGGGAGSASGSGPRARLPTPPPAAPAPAGIVAGKGAASRARTPPPPLPPPADFPEFHNEEEIPEMNAYNQEANSFDEGAKRRRRKRPRRPLFDERVKQEFQSERGSTNQGYPSSGVYMNGRRQSLYKPRPYGYDVYDMDYSPSDKQETLTTGLRYVQEVLHFIHNPFHHNHKML